MKIKVSNISVRDLDNTGSVFDGQDPALQLKIGAIAHITER